MSFKAIPLSWWLAPSALRMEDLIFSIVIDLLGLMGARRSRRMRLEVDAEGIFRAGGESTKGGRMDGLPTAAGCRLRCVCDTAGGLTSKTMILSLFVLLEALCTAFITLAGLSLFHLYRLVRPWHAVGAGGCPGCAGRALRPGPTGFSGRISACDPRLAA